MSIPPHSSPEQDLLARVAHAVAPAYDIERELGRGGSGIVYRAMDRRLKRSVALKILPPDLAFRSDVRERFLREAETAASLNHPNIVPIFSVDEREGLAWFAMALVEGESIGERVRRTGAASYAEARRMLREVGDALAYAHARGVVHRDIKPDNILLDAQTGRALVTDFGIARATTDESRLTATGTAIGTPAYMSPEQCAGDRQLDGRSDLYSLGAVAYYMITGQPVFDGPSTPVIMMKHVTERPVSIARYRHDVPPDLDAVVMKLLEKDPSHRFADGESLVNALISGTFNAPREEYSTYPSMQRADTRMPTLQQSFQEMTGRPFPVPSALDIGPIVGARIQSRMAFHEVRRLRREARAQQKEILENSRPLSDRVRSFRRHIVRYMGTTAFLFGINAVTSGGAHHFWWAAFPALGMMLGLINEGGSLWAAGAKLRDGFGSTNALRAAEASQAALAAPSGASVAPPKPDADAELIAEVLAGPRGNVARQAVADRRAIKDLVARLSKAEREMLPDVEGTSEGLYQRIAELGRALHRLDSEIEPSQVSDLDERIAKSETAETGSDSERRLRLLKRQREMLTHLLESRDRLSEQYESAGLLLQNLKLDLIRMRSSGLQSGLADVTSVTQEARALSKEIGYVLAAADELRDIGG
ncbi:MAG: protein kinase domain-containing protein [Gemmatimonas sp.]